MEINKTPSHSDKNKSEARSVLNDLYIAKQFFVWKDTPTGLHIVSILDDLSKEKRKE